MVTKPTEPFWQPCPRAGGRMEWTCPCGRDSSTGMPGVGHGNHDHGCCSESCCSRDDYPGRTADGETKTASGGVILCG